MKRMLKESEPLVGTYREESPKTAVFATVAAVILIGTPLSMANKKIETEGARTADISRYSKLAQKIDDNVGIVKDVLDKGVVDEKILATGGIVASKGTTLITPRVMPTNVNESTDDPNVLNVNLSAIFWNQSDPIVTIDNENYHVGELIKGFKILEIRKTEVLFRSPTGDKVVKYFYDYL